jgi:hypothetical protein
MRSRRVTGRLSATTSDIDKLRDRARRLMELARRASGEDRPDYATLLTQLATEAREQAASWSAVPVFTHQIARGALTQSADG